MSESDNRWNAEDHEPAEHPHHEPPAVWPQYTWPPAADHAADITDPTPVTPPRAAGRRRADRADLRVVAAGARHRARLDRAVRHRAVPVRTVRDGSLLARALRHPALRHPALRRSAVRPATRGTTSDAGSGGTWGPPPPPWGAPGPGWVPAHA